MPLIPTYGKLFPTTHPLPPRAIRPPVALISRYPRPLLVSFITLGPKSWSHEKAICRERLRPRMDPFRLLARLYSTKSLYALLFSVHTRRFRPLARCSLGHTCSEPHISSTGHFRTLGHNVYSAYYTLSTFHAPTADTHACYLPTRATTGPKDGPQ